jgi:hypothetical protein
MLGVEGAWRRAELGDLAVVTWRWWSSEFLKFLYSIGRLRWERVERFAMATMTWSFSMVEQRSMVWWSILNPFSRDANANPIIPPLAMLKRRPSSCNQTWLDRFD